MKIISALPRILLGLAFGVLPWLAILHLAPNQGNPPAATAFTDALMKTGYMLPLVWGTEIVAGMLLLVGVFVPFALILLAPVLVNILLFHAFLAPSGNVLALVLCLLGMAVAWQHRRAFDSLFTSGASG
jgi:uncharacterized membrane protein YphA (DoxX/SURF4 family)